MVEERIQKGRKGKYVLGRMRSFIIYLLGIVEENMGEKQVFKKECLRILHNC